MMRLATAALLSLFLASCSREQSQGHNTAARELPEFSASQTGSAFPSQVVPEIVALAESVTPARWMQSHPGDTLQAYTGTGSRDAGPGWCARATRHQPGLEARVTRYAYFYPPAPPGTLALPPADSGLIATQCRLGAIWLESDDPRLGPLVALRLRDTLSLTYGAAARSLSQDVGFMGSASWESLGWWQRDSLTIVTAYDRGMGDTKPRVVAFAFFPLSLFGHSFEANEGLEERARQREHQLAARAAQLSGIDSALVERLLRTDSAANAAWHTGSTPDARAAAHNLTTVLSVWIDSSRGLPPARRAAALLAADQVLGAPSTAYLLARDSSISDSLRRLGAVIVYDQLGAGNVYAHSWLDEAQRLDAAGPVSALATLALLRMGFNTSGMCGGTESASQRVSRLAEEALRTGADSADAAELHVLAAHGYADIVALAHGAGMDYADSTQYVAAEPAARVHAIEHYRRALAIGLPAADARDAWLEGWRLLGGLAPLRTHFFCVYD